MLIVFTVCINGPRCHASVKCCGLVSIRSSVPAARRCGDEYAERHIAEHMNKFLDTWPAHCYSVSRRVGYGPEHVHERQPERMVRLGW